MNKLIFNSNYFVLANKYKKLLFKAKKVSKTIIAIKKIFRHHKLTELVRNGKAIVFVSFDLSSVQGIYEMCKGLCPFNYMPISDCRNVEGLVWSWLSNSSENLGKKVRALCRSPEFVNPNLSTICLFGPCLGTRAL